MDLLTVMDALQVHALAAATTAGGATLTDVAVGFPPAKGRCVRIFYGGERETEFFGQGYVLDSKLVGQAIVIRGYWPTASTGVKEQRAIEGQMGTFVKQLRTRIHGDSDVGGQGVDLVIIPTPADQVTVAGVEYAITNTEIVVDFDEYTRSR